MLFKLSNLNKNLALTLGYLNPALNNSAQGVSPVSVSHWSMVCGNHNSITINMSDNIIYAAYIIHAILN